jgi:uncharacterized low-complexity protein
MKKSVLSLLTGAALLGTVGVASAAEPMILANAAMDTITAGSVYQRAVAVAANRCNRSVCQANAAAVNQNGFVNTANITQVNVALDIDID